MKKLTGVQKEQLSLALFYTVGIAFCIVFSYYAWHWGRQLNYSWSYKDMVTETICETVKHEHLQNPKLCEKQHDSK